MVVAALAGLTAAQPAGALVYAERPAPVSQDDLDRLAAPIALFPDLLLAQVLAAATYPAEVAEAAAFLDEHGPLRGQELAMRIREQNWEPTVAALLQFPTVLALMRDNPEWVKELGDAFLRDEAPVLETVQTLRNLALNQGALRTSREQKVYTDGDRVTILPATAREVCVPVYDAATVYGPWWLPDKPPLSWKPRRQGPRVHDMLSAGVSFAPCNTLATGSFLTAEPDWETRGIEVTGRGASAVWEHDPAHRRGVPYPTAAVRARFEPDGPGRTGVLRRGMATAPGVIIIRPGLDQTKPSGESR
jgi:hypothetical protein